jgi:anti-anti-sigma factor
MREAGDWLDHDVVRARSRTTVIVRGEVDIRSARAVDKVLNRIDPDVPALDLDLRAVSFMDVTGARAVVRNYAVAEARGTKVNIKASPAVARIFTLMGVQGLLFSPVTI